MTDHPSNRHERLKVSLPWPLLKLVCFTFPVVSILHGFCILYNDMCFCSISISFHAFARPRRDYCANSLRDHHLHVYASLLLVAAGRYSCRARFSLKKLVNIVHRLAQQCSRFPCPVNTQRHPRNGWQLHVVQHLAKRRVTSLLGFFRARALEMRGSGKDF